MGLEDLFVSFCIPSWECQSAPTPHPLTIHGPAPRRGELMRSSKRRQLLRCQGTARRPARRLPILRCGLNRTEQQTLLSWKYLMQFLWNIISQLSSLVLINTGFKTWNLKHQGFPGGSDRKASACNVGDPGSIPGSGRSPGKGNGNQLQYSCLESPMDGGAW